MQRILKKSFIVIETIALLAYGCGSDSTPPATETPAVSLSGKLSQTYVNGATIFADKIIDGTTLGNYTQDTNEVSTTATIPVNSILTYRLATMITCLSPKGAW